MSESVWNSTHTKQQLTRSARATASLKSFTSAQHSSVRSGLVLETGYMRGVNDVLVSLVSPVDSLVAL